MESLRTTISNKNGLTWMLWVLLLLLCSVMECQAVGKPKFCGQALNEVLDLVCVKGFHPKIKRFDKQANTMRYKDMSEILEILPLPDCTLHQLTNGKPCARKLFVKSQQKHQSRLRRSLGIVHECCQNGCNYMDIGQYCL